MSAKERLRKFAVPIIVAGSLGLSAGACGIPKQMEPTPQRLPNATATRELFGQIGQEELIKTTSKLFCEIVPCVINAQDLQRKVHVLEKEAYLDAIEKSIGRGPRDQEQLISEGVIVPIPNSIKRQDREILINATKAGQGIETLKSLLFLGYLKVSVSDEDVSIEPFVIQDSFGNRVTMNRINQLELIGVDNSNRVASQDGASIAMSAHVMSIVNARTRIVEINKNQDVSDAALFLKQLTDLAGISDQEFLSYYVGKNSIIDFLNRLGSINPSSKQTLIDGRTLFTLISLKGNGAIPDNNNLRKEIENIIGRPLLNTLRSPQI